MKETHDLIRNAFLSIFRGGAGDAKAVAVQGPEAQDVFHRGCQTLP